jgi:hypothetical protein
MNGSATVLGFNKFEKALVLIIPMAAGGLIGWFLPVLAKWMLKLPIVPVEKLFALIASSTSIWISIGAAVIGIAGGVLLTVIIFDENLEVTVSDYAVQLKVRDKTTTIGKKDITAVYMEKKQLVFLGQKSEELFREAVEAKVDAACEAFQQHHYPWAEKDPYESQYQRWVLGHPDFSEKANAFLYARETALKEDKKKDAKYLREDLARLGIVIKDERNGQYVRVADGLNHGAD